MLRPDPFHRRRARIVPSAFATGLAFVIALLAFCTPASAQLNGNYTIGGAGANFTSIDGALTALNGGVTGPVTFLIRSGTYVPPTGGWRLAAVGGLSATNTVRFKPDAGATVMLAGNTGSYNLSGVFTIDGGSYYTIDGSNNGGTSKDMTISQTENQYNSAIILKNNADFNTVKNCNVQTSSQYNYVGYGFGVVFIAQGTGNDNNLIQNCTLGDPTGLNRAYCGVAIYGTSLNTNNKVIGCDIVNFRQMGVYVDGSNQNVIIQKNIIHQTSPAPNTSLYGIYVNENNVGMGVSIDSNKIYKLTPTLNPSASVYGIASFTNSVPSGTMQITNNMISLADDGYITYYGIYMSNNMSSTSTAYTDNIYYNSIYTGGVAQSFGATYIIYRYSYSSSGLGFTTVNHKNNAYYATRQGGSTTSYSMYVYASPSGGWNSSNNLLNLNSDINYYTAYYNFSLYSTLASYQTSGQDVNSVGTNPQFVDPVNGDLHISTTKRTAVESRGVTVAGFTTDFDGQARNATTPDIGADEGTFVAPIAIDGAADRFTSPLPGAIVRSNTAFAPVAWAVNNGSTSQIVPVRFRILNSSNAVVYNDLQNYSISAFMSQRVPFNSTGNNGGTTSLPAGVYTMELSTAVTGDGDATNNIITATLIVKDQLNGIYTIDKNGAGARNYTSFTSTIADLLAVGVSAPVTFRIASGTYDSTTEVFPLKFPAVPTVNATNPVTYKPDVGATVVMASGQLNTQVIDFSDADYFTLDGSNVTNGTTRNWKVINSNSGAAVRFINGAQYNTVKNMNLIAYNPTTTGIIYFAGYGGTPSGNSFNTILGNTLGDSAGNFRSFANIYLSGDFSYRNSANVIDGNDIINWGANVNGGGYGIYISSYSDQIKIFRNRFTQTATVGLTGFSSCFGIYVANSYNGADTIAQNKFWGLGTPTAAEQQAGIYISTLGQSTPFSIHDNMMTLTGDAGNLWGVAALSSSPSTINMDHNTIVIRGASTGGTNYVSAGARTAGAPIFTMRNNIIINQRTYPAASIANYAIYRGTASGTFASNYNLLYTVVNGLSNNLVYNNGTNYVTLANWQATGFDANSVTGIPPFVDQANGDLHINPAPIFTGEGVGTALPYLRDYDNVTRDIVTPDMGADDGDFNGGGIKLTYPNGGETFAPGDPVAVLYSTNRAMSVRIEMSSDLGVTWTQLGTVSPTLKGNNSTNITLPDVAVNQALLRVISQKSIYEADTTDAPFRVVRKLKLKSPNGGEQWFVGDSVKLKWDRKPGEGLSDYINLEYTTDGGSTWKSIAQQIPAYIDSLPWLVPNTPTVNAMVRITNREVARYWDTSDTKFSILTASLAVTLPNGGEKYELNQPVTVTWTSLNTTTLMVLYSSDNGGTWKTISSAVPAAAGTYTFTPVALPTKLGLVRLVNADRTRINDQSDQTFEIMPAKSISVYTPSAGDALVTGSSTVITWDAPRVSSVNISFSSNGGTTWQIVASNVLASEGSRVWTVPSLTTTQGKIRIQEVGGPVIGESDLFAIVRPTTPTIAVIAPNGGESFTGGDTITVSWSASDVQTVTAAYSNNNGITWNLIQGGIPASLGQIKWVAPDVESIYYLVRISSTAPAASDASDAAFSIRKKPKPSMIVLYPNGGENLTIDSTVDIRWTAQDLIGNVKVELSRDNGATWDSIASVSAFNGGYSWTVTGDSTSHALIRVGEQNVANGLDTSDAVFTISRKVVEPIVVLAPNGGEQWYMRSKQDIKWTAPSSVSAVDIEYSTDGGGNWISVQTNVASAGATPQFTWTIPNLSSSSQSALVRISDHATSGLKDISNNTFSVLNPVAGVEAPVAGMGSLNLLGNFPNPFAASTELRWRQAGASDVEIRIYEQNGTMVGRYSAGHREGGEQHFTVSGADLASGVYIYEVRTGKDVARGVMMLVR